jgi:hypothetical protein
VLGRHFTWSAVHLEPGFSGLKTNTVAETTPFPQLVLAKDANQNYRANGTLELPVAITAPDTNTFRVQSTIVADARSDLNKISSWKPLSAVSALSGTSGDEWEVSFEYATSEQLAAPFTWTDWAKATLIDVSTRNIKFRLVLETNTPKVTPLVHSALIEVLLPERIQQDRSVTVDAIGTRINYAPSFIVEPALAAIGANLQAGDNVRIANKDATGFTAQVVKANNTPVSGTIDYVARGFGRGT